MENNNLILGVVELLKIAFASPEAIELLNRLAASLTSQNHVQARQTHTLEEFSKEILDYHNSPNTNRGTKTAFNRLLKFTGNVMLDAITPKIKDSFLNWAKKSAPKGVYNYERTLKAAFNIAIFWGYIIENPFGKNKLPKRQKSELVTILRAELNLILETVKNPLFKILFLFAFLTGLRLGEIVSLSWEDVNLEKKIIQVGSDSFQTKSRKIRYVPLCNEAAELLQSIKPKVFKITEKKHYVFSKENGYPFTTSYISKQFKKSVIASGVNPKIHFHTLRHGFATALAKQGVSLYKIQNILGHSSISTVQIYANLDVEDLRDAVKVFDNN